MQERLEFRSCSCMDRMIGKFLHIPALSSNAKLSRFRMSVDGGHDAVAKMQAAQEAALKNATPAERARENGDQKVVVVPNAGHHLYLDNYKFFNDAIDKELADVEQRNKRLETLSKA